jgi:hypothetical protein
VDGDKTIALNQVSRVGDRVFKCSATGNEVTDVTDGLNVCGICAYIPMTAASKCASTDGKTYLFGDEWDDIHGEHQTDTYEFFVHF